MSQLSLLHGVMGFVIGVVCTLVMLGSYRWDNYSTKIVGPPLSHSDLDRYNAGGDIITAEFNDSILHENETTEELQNLTSSMKILVWVMTSPENLAKKAIHVKKTWGRRADILLFMSSKDDPNFPAVGIKTEEGRTHLTAKTMQGFKYAYDHYYDKADWFMKCDDDSFVIIENLRYFLSDKNTKSPVFYGHWFKPYLAQGYYSGGGGYVLSKEALRRFVNREKGKCRDDGGAEDVEMGRCMNALGVKTADTRDALGRSRFHCLTPQSHLGGHYPEWYYRYDMFGAQKGVDALSDYPITFHYISPEQMYQLEYFTYHLRPWGIVPPPPGLNYNTPPEKSKTKPEPRP